MESEHDGYVFNKRYKSGTKCSGVVHVDGLLIAAMLVITRSFWALGTTTFPFVKDTVIVLNLDLSQLPRNLFEGILEKSCGLYTPIEGCV